MLFTLGISIFYFLLRILALITISISNHLVLLVTFYTARLTPTFWFRKYRKKHKLYLQKLNQYKIVQRRLNNLMLRENSNVNENIRCYVETQKIKKQKCQIEAVLDLTQCLY
jgi:hypothetical protein